MRGQTSLLICSWQICWILTNFTIPTKFTRVYLSFISPQHFSTGPFALPENQENLIRERGVWGQEVVWQQHWKEKGKQLVPLQSPCSQWQDGWWWIHGCLGCQVLLEQSPPPVRNPQREPHHPVNERSSECKGKITKLRNHKAAHCLHSTCPGAICSEPEPPLTRDPTRGRRTLLGRNSDDLCMSDIESNTEGAT